MIAQRVAALRKEIGADVVLCGVTKGQPAEVIADAVRAGVRVLGDNYVQEGVALRAALADKLPPTDLAALEWHFIGHIQSRKAKALDGYSLVQSIDRVSVAAAFDAKLATAGKSAGILVEVNVGGEAQKSGIAPGALSEILAALAACKQLRVRGLMAMPPPLELEARRPFFKRMRRLFEEHAGFDILSMGTSTDYRIAVDEGATMVRLGTTLFGPR